MNAGVTGSYDLQFQLFNALTGSIQVGMTQSLPTVPVADGVFYAEINFGAVIGTLGLYLQTSYRKAGATTYVTETPRQKLSEAGYADYATEAGYALTAGSAATAATAARMPTASESMDRVVAASSPRPSSARKSRGTGSRSRPTTPASRSPGR